MAARRQNGTNPPQAQSVPANTTAGVDQTDPGTGGTTEAEGTNEGYSSENHYRTQWGLRTMTRAEVDELRRMYPHFDYIPVESLEPGEVPIVHEEEARATAEATADEKLPDDPGGEQSGQKTTEA
jgi:hypothetical protein